MNYKLLPPHLYNLASTNIASHRCCKFRAVATATTATFSTFATFRGICSLRLCHQMADGMALLPEVASTALNPDSQESRDSHSYHISPHFSINYNLLTANYISDP
jgi:hypothetical protein